MPASLTWLGCTTFLLEADDVRLLLDAYVRRVFSAPPVPLDGIDLATIDGILIGHGHAHHLGDAAWIAGQNAARVACHVTAAAELAAHGLDPARIDVAAGGERFRYSETVTVRTLPFLHACDWLPAGTAPDHRGIDEIARQSLDAGSERLRELIDAGGPGAAEMAGHLALIPGTTWHGGVVGYLIEWSDGSLLFQDSAGAWSSVLSGLRPTTAILAAAGNPNLDGDPFEGTNEQFVALEASLLGWPEVIPCHHDNWMPPFTRQRATPFSIAEFVPPGAPDAMELASGVAVELRAAPWLPGPELPEAPCPVCGSFVDALYTSHDGEGQHVRLFCRACATRDEYRDRIAQGNAALMAIGALGGWALQRMLSHAAEAEAARRNK